MKLILNIIFVSGFIVLHSADCATVTKGAAAPACESLVSKKYLGVLVVGGKASEARPGDVVELECTKGYNATQGSELMRVCQDNSTWNDTSNPCAAFKCGEPKSFPNQGLTLNGSSEDHHYLGKPLMYQCKPGYTFSAGQGAQKIIFCNEKGQWSNEGDAVFPHCKRVACEITKDLSPPEHASWNLFDENGNRIMPALGRTVPSHSAIEYTCTKGYVMVGEPKRSCSAHQENIWSGKPILCEEDNGIPGLTNMQIAIIAATISGIIILVVGSSLIYCCVKEKKQRRINVEQQQRNGRTRRFYSDHSLMRHSRSYNVSGYMNKRNKPTPSNYFLFNANSVPLHSQTNRYAGNKPHMLPASVQPGRPERNQPSSSALNHNGGGLPRHHVRNTRRTSHQSNSNFDYNAFYEKQNRRR